MTYEKCLLSLEKARIAARGFLGRLWDLVPKGSEVNLHDLRPL